MEENTMGYLYTERDGVTSGTCAGTNMVLYMFYGGQKWFHRSRTPMTDEILTISVPEAGQKYFGLSRNGAYAAAERGEIPTIRIGRLKRVPVRAMEALLNRVSENAMAES
jgi:hypothetical protein